MLDKEFAIVYTNNSNHYYLGEGMRFSKQREVIKDVTKNTTIHPDADWIYKESARIIPNISLGTVYRNLKELVAMGELNTLETEDNVLHYDGNVDSHSHFICRYCHSIIDLEWESGARDRLTAEGFEVDCEKLLLYGKCPSCKTKNSNA